MPTGVNTCKTGLHYIIPVCMDSWYRELAETWEAGVYCIPVKLCIPEEPMFKLIVYTWKAKVYLESGNTDRWCIPRVLGINRDLYSTVQ